MIPTPAQPKKR
jgi:transposase